MKKTFTNLLAGVFCILTFFTAIPAQANVAIPETSSFYLDWLGFNGAEAHATLEINNALFPNPSNGLAFLTPGNEIVSFALTVYDTVLGSVSNYQLADFDAFSWDSMVTLDLSQELIGQQKGNGGWGTEFVNGETGDFNIFATEGSGAPSSDGSYFHIATNEGLGTAMTLTSFRPVPLPAAFWLFGSSLFGFIAISRKKPEAQLI